MARRFALTFDYRCPFARNAHEAVVAGIREGRDWEVDFVPFSLDQVHLAEGETPVWERDLTEAGKGLRALLWGVAVRDVFPEQFLNFHLALFSARHDHGHQISDEAVLAEVAAGVGVDPVAVAAEVASGRPAKTLAGEHVDAARRHRAFGVPTVIEGDEAVFVRIMERGHVADFAQALDLVGWSGLNEFKRTTIPR